MPAEDKPAEGLFAWVNGIGDEYRVFCGYGQNQKEIGSGFVTRWAAQGHADEINMNLESIVKTLREKAENLQARVEELEKEVVAEKWVCGDCGCQNIKGTETWTDYGTEYDSICEDCGSSNCGEIGQAIFDVIDDRDDLKDARDAALKELAEAEKDRAAWKEKAESLDKAWREEQRAAYAAIADADRLAELLKQVLSGPEGFMAAALDINIVKALAAHEKLKGGA